YHLQALRGVEHAPAHLRAVAHDPAFRLRDGRLQRRRLVHQLRAIVDVEALRQRLDRRRVHELADDKPLLHSITPIFPTWEPMYQSRPSAATIILRMPVFSVGSLITCIFSVAGSRRITVLPLISSTHGWPAPSTVTAYAPPPFPEGNGYFLRIFCA